MPIGKKREHPAFELWRQESPLVKLAAHRDMSVPQYLGLVYDSKSASFDVSLMPSDRMIRKIADFEGLDTWNLGDKFRTWYALKPENAWLHHANEVWIRRCPMRVRRDDLGWSQTELAKRAGVCLMTVSHNERGRQGPSDRVMNKYAKAFGISPLTLFREVRRWKDNRPSERTAERWLEKELLREQG